MAKHSSIEWTDHTFNPWYGCTKVSPGCEHCYAEAMMDHRYHKVQWGEGRPRQRTSAANWNEPVKWNRAVVLRRHQMGPGGGVETVTPQRPRVFCASLADWLDEEVPIEWLADLLRLIFETPHLDWLLLTKRPENWLRRLDDVIDWCPEEWDGDDCPAWVWWLQKWMVDQIAPSNVWIGTTVEDQPRAAQRIPEMIEIPARVRFLSCEPLLGPVVIKPEWLTLELQTQSTCFPRIDWVIAGGESGAEARPMHPDWARSLRDQCTAADVPFFFKQWGEWFPRDQWEGNPDLVLPDDCDAYVNNERTIYRKEPGNAGHCVWHKVGKKAAGRLLDGVEHNAFPCSAEAAQDQPEVVV